MCFNLAWFEGLLTWLVWVVLGISILWLCRQFLIPKLKIGADWAVFISTIIYWVIIACIAIVGIRIAFDVLACALSYPRLR